MAIRGMRKLRPLQPRPARLTPLVPRRPAAGCRDGDPLFVVLQAVRHVVAVSFIVHLTVAVEVRCDTVSSPPKALATHRADENVITYGHMR